MQRQRGTRCVVWGVWGGLGVVLIARIAPNPPRATRHSIPNPHRADSGPCTLHADPNPKASGPARHAANFRYTQATWLNQAPKCLGAIGFDAGTERQLACGGLPTHLLIGTY